MFLIDHGVSTVAPAARPRPYFAVREPFIPAPTRPTLRTRDGERELVEVWARTFPPGTPSPDDAVDVLVYADGQPADYFDGER